MDLETLGAARREALMTVFQDLVSGGQAFPVSLKQFYTLACKSFPQFLLGWVLWGEQSSLMFPRFVPSLFMGWPLPDILFLPFLCTYSCFSVLNSPVEWGSMKILDIPPSLCLPGLSSFIILTVTTSVSCWATLADSNFSTQSQHPWKWTISSFFIS